MPSLFLGLYFTSRPKELIAHFPFPYLHRPPWMNSLAGTIRRTSCGSPPPTASPYALCTMCMFTLDSGPASCYFPSVTMESLGRASWTSTAWPGVILPPGAHSARQLLMYFYNVHFNLLTIVWRMFTEIKFSYFIGRFSSQTKGYIGICSLLSSSGKDVWVPRW